MNGAPSSVGLASVVAVHQDGVHRFSKTTVPAIQLLAGLGVQGDAHAGVTVKHRSRVARDPGQPNLRQVHLIHAELFETLAAQGHPVRPGDLGENLTTRGIDLLSLGTGTCLRIGAEAVIELTGLRNPCAQIDRFQRGLMSRLLDRDPQGGLVRLAGVMAIVRVGGRVAPGDPIVIDAAPVHRPLEPV